jgi:hypothetical protein
MRLPFGVADQIETTTEPGASRKGFAGAHESKAALGMPEEGSRVRALYAHSKKSRWRARRARPKQTRVMGATRVTLFSPYFGLFRPFSPQGDQRNVRDATHAK